MSARHAAWLLLLGAIWGGSFIAIRVAVPLLGPVLLVELRVLIAGVILLGVALGGRRALAFRARWRDYLVIGVLNSALPFVLISAAELVITASTASILNATTPLFGALLATVWIGEALTARRGVGLVLGVVGVAVLVGWQPEPITTPIALAIAASLGAALLYAIASLYIKTRARGAPLLGMVTGSQLGSALILAPVVPFTLEGLRVNGATVVAVLFLGVIATAFAYLLYFRLIEEAGPTRALTVTYLVPLFGVLWGALLLNESLTPGTVVGCIIVIAGTMLVTGFSPRRMLADARTARRAAGGTV